MGIEAKGDGGLVEFHALLKGSKHALTQMHSLWALGLGSSLKGTRGMWGGTELSAMWTKAGRGSFLPEAFFWDLPTTERAGKDAPYLRFHQPGSYYLPSHGDSLGPAPPHCQAQPVRFQWLFHTSDLSRLLLQIFLKSLKQAASFLSMPGTSH